MRNVILNHLSPDLRKTLPVIPILPTTLAIENRASPISPVEAAVPTNHQCRGYERKSMNAESRTGNALAMAQDTTKAFLLPNTASRAPLNRNPAITSAMTANQLNAKSHSTRNHKKSSLPPLISNSMGKAG